MKYKWLNISVTCMAILTIITNANALTFNRKGNNIYISGDIISGDTERFSNYIKTQQVNTDDGTPDVSLNSRGGSLTEGILLGKFFRRNSIATYVENGRECYSACAVAFLGGTQRYANGSGVGRYLEVGAKLGFHGFTSSKETVIMLNEAFDVARAINGYIIQYASDMKKIDTSLLSELISTDPKSIRIVNTPRELNGLGITVKGSLPQRPKNWSYNACRRHIESAYPIDDYGINNRISSQSGWITFNKTKDFQQTLITDLFQYFTQIDITKLPTSFIANIITEADPQPPIHKISISRGAGFYYDYCYAFESYPSSNDVTTILISTMADGSRITKSHGPLGWYNDNAQLWMK